MAIFPKALLLCIAEAREPRDGELEEIAAHIWHDSFESVAGCPWRDMGRLDHRRAWMLAIVRRGLDWPGKMAPTNVPLRPGAPPVARPVLEAI